MVFATSIIQNVVKKAFRKKALKKKERISMNYMCR